MRVGFRVVAVVGSQQTRQRAAWYAAWKGPIPLTGPNDRTLLDRSRSAESTNGVQFITATIDALTSRDLTVDRVQSSTHDGVEVAPADSIMAGGDVDRRWCELILGRLVDPLTGVAWDATLLQLIQRETQNFLLLLWRARAGRLGGVPTLMTQGRGITMMPYERMKTIGGRSVQRPTMEHRQEDDQLNP